MDETGGRSLRPVPKRILSGAEEGIFRVLPQHIYKNLLRANSENALLWNLIYPLAQPGICFRKLVDLRPLWGTVDLESEGEGALQPFFWGYSLDGEPLEGLDTVLAAVDGPGPQTEVDLFLVGQSRLVVVEAKHMGAPGRCSRYARRRCPEMHAPAGNASESCRYWERGGAGFSQHLQFGPRPRRGDPSPPCNRHYQLARTLLIGQELARAKNLDLHLWMMVPRNRWPAIEGTWLDFTQRVRDADLWRRLRVLAWEDVRALHGEA